MVFDPCTKDSLIIVGADLFLTVIGNALPKESGDIVRFYCKDFRSDDLVIKGSRSPGCLNMMSVAHSICWTVHV